MAVRLRLHAVQTRFRAGSGVVLRLPQTMTTYIRLLNDVHPIGVPRHCLNAFLPMQICSGLVHVSHAQHNGEHRVRPRVQCQ